MTIDQLLREVGNILYNAGNERALQESEIILKEISGKDLATLLSHSEDEIEDGISSRVISIAKKRASGMPLGYALGSTAFFNWKLITDKRALIPRPETEMLCEEAIRIIRKSGKESGKFLEIGTGSGAISVVLKKYFPDSEIIATDISEDALELAELNASRLKLDIEFIESDLLGKVPKSKFDVVIANLPYVPSSSIATISPQIRDWEPMNALDGGISGFDIIERLMSKIGPYLNDDGIILLEVWHTHKPVIEKAVSEYLPDKEVTVLKDLAGLDRFAIIT